MPRELEEVRAYVVVVARSLRRCIDAARETLAAGRTLWPEAWAAIDSLTDLLVDAFGELEQAERRAGLR